MATISPTFHGSFNADSLPVIIPGREIPTVALRIDGSTSSVYGPTSSPDEARRRGLHWLGVERAMRKRIAAQETADRLRAQAEAKAKESEEEIAVLAEAKELRLAYYNDACPDWSQLGQSARVPWLRQAREALQRHGKLASHE